MLALPTLTVVAALVGSTSPPSPSSDPAVMSEFAVTAAEHCTTVINDHIGGDPLGDPFDVYVAVFEDEDPAPSAADLDGWAADLAGWIERSGTIQTSLAELEAPDPDEQAAWATIVDSGHDDAVAAHAERLVALETGDWESVKTAVNDTRGGPTPDPAIGVALASLGLTDTDCAAVYNEYNAGRVGEWAPFVREASTACTTIFLRRLGSDWLADRELVLGALGDVVNGDDVAITDEFEAALARHAAEWRQTAADLSGVDGSGAPDPEAWDAAVGFAEQEAEIWAARVTSVASGDQAAIAAAYRLDREYPGIDFDVLGLDWRPPCRSVV